MTLDLCVVGAGSAGIGAALAGARAGLSTVLIEKGDSLGGNAARGGVNNWEPSVGGTAFPREIFERLQCLPDAVGVWTMNRHWCWPQRNMPPFPGGEQLVDSERRYEDTLLRHGTRGLVVDAERVHRQWHGVVFEPDAYADVVEGMLEETGNCDIRKMTTFITADHSAGRVTSITVTGRDGSSEKITARCFIDATADGLLCRAIDCEEMLGEEPASMFGEPSAPEVGLAHQINAVTLVYRVTPSTSGIELLPEMVDESCWFRREWGGGSIVQYPCGDLNINMLPTMEGSEFYDYVKRGAQGYQLAYDECRRRVVGHWHSIQTSYPEFQNFRIKHIAPALGVRESRRIVGNYILTEHDLRLGLSGQAHADIIAIADHAIDVHGGGNRHAGNGCPELDMPYGVPYRCLIPKGWKNLFVAGRCASFSHIAASSCRLSRTMMDLGHAAGLGAVLAVGADEQAIEVANVDLGALRQMLLEQGATLSSTSLGA